MIKLRIKYIFNLLIISILLFSCYKSDDVGDILLVEPSEFTQKVLIEDYTGTWCVNCPKAGAAIHRVVHGANGNDRFIPVAIHYRSSEEEMMNEFSQALVAQFNPNGIFPTVALNRNEAIWADDYLVSNLESKLNRYAPVGLAINSTLTGNLIDLTVQVGFVEELTTVNNYKLVVYLVEDGLIYPQHTISTPSIIEDYVHNDVLRYSFTDTLGDALPNEIAVDHRHTKSFMSIALPNTIQNTSNIRIVAFVVDATNNCLNVQMAPVGVDKDFD